MGFRIPSFSNVVSNAANAVGQAAGKVASAVTNQAPATPPQAPAAPTKPVDSFETTPAKPNVCGGTDTAGAQCLPTWGKDSGGGGGGLGVNPSRR